MFSTVPVQIGWVPAALCSAAKAGEDNSRA
jgi:hypothetical protein